MKTIITSLLFFVSIHLVQGQMTSFLNEYPGRIKEGTFYIDNSNTHVAKINDILISINLPTMGNHFKPPVATQLY